MLALMTEKFRMCGRFKKHRISPKNSSERIAKAKMPKTATASETVFSKMENQRGNQRGGEGGVWIWIWGEFGEEIGMNMIDTLYNIL